MSRRMWVGLAIAALVAAVLTIPASGQGTVIDDSQSYTGHVSGSPVTVTGSNKAKCTAGSDLDVWVTLGGSGTTGTTMPAQTRRIRVSSAGFSSASLSTYDSHATMTPSGTFSRSPSKCADSGPANVTFQAERNTTGSTWVPDGNPYFVTINYNTCPPSPATC